MEKKTKNSKFPKLNNPKDSKRIASANKSPIIEQEISKYRAIDYEKLKEIPEITLTIKLDQSRMDGSTFEIKMGINLTIRKVLEKINERHCNSCKNIKIYLIENSQKKYMDIVTYKTFEELGFKGGENLNFFYEYEPFKHPLLEAGLV